MSDYALVKKSFRLAGHATSVALEPEFWAVLEQTSRQKGQSLAALVGAVDASRGERNLASALRVFCLSR